MKTKARRRDRHTIKRKRGKEHEGEKSANKRTSTCERKSGKSELGGVGTN